MAAARKSFLLLVAWILLLCAIWPMPRTFAEAEVSGFRVINPYSYLIAGYTYIFDFSDNKAPLTDIDFHYDYSPDNGATWIRIPDEKYIDPNGSFILPIDPQLTSVKFRIVAHFSPAFGSDSDSQQTIGPFKVMQPTSPSDVTATPNMDGSVTLAWNDNSNMESALSDYS